MRQLILILIATLVPVFAAQGGEFIHLADEVRLPLPDGWVLGTDTVEFPFQLVHADDGGEILIFRNEIESDERVTDDVELRRTVDDIITDIVSSVPDARLLTSTGFNDIYRAGFVVEFRSTDSASGVSLRQRMRGMLYQHPDGYQVLFTVWSKTSRERYPELAPSIIMIEEEFAYVGPQEPEVFGATDTSVWPLILSVILVIGAVLYFRSRRQRGSLPPLPGDSRFWRCACGRLNHESKPACRRCGRDREADRADDL